MEHWRSQFSKFMQEDTAEWEEEQMFQEQIFFSGTFQLGPTDNRRLQDGRAKKRRVKDRKREEGHDMIWNDYFSDSPTYNEIDFRRRFRMSKRLFTKLLGDVSTHDAYFQQKRDAANKRGLSGLQKITAALRQLAHGVGADATDEYCRLGDSTARLSLYRFCQAIRIVHGDKYLRKPTSEDFARIMAVNEKRGFPGMFGSLDCMHYTWKNCPVAWQGQFTDKDGHKSIILEAIADHELWIWHAFFGLAGGSNDLNVLDRSPLLNDIIHGKYDQSVFTVNGINFKGAYLLVDGIYPPWSCFVQTIHRPQSEKNKFYAKCQEGVRKDVERAFGVLQARWGIIRQPACSWHLDRVTDILLACVILHNMIIEDERGENLEEIRVSPANSTSNRTNLPWKEYLLAINQVENAELHFRLRNSLIEHLWTKKGRNEIE